jgi:hypothetical protein
MFVFVKENGFLGHETHPLPRLSKLSKSQFLWYCVIPYMLCNLTLQSYWFAGCTLILFFVYFFWGQHSQTLWNSKHLNVRLNRGKLKWKEGHSRKLHAAWMWILNSLISHVSRVLANIMTESSNQFWNCNRNSRDMFLYKCLPKSLGRLLYMHV